LKGEITKLLLKIEISPKFLEGEVINPFLKIQIILELQRKVSEPLCEILPLLIARRKVTKPCYATFHVIKGIKEKSSTLEDSESSNVELEENIFTEMNHLILTLMKLTQSHNYKSKKNKPFSKIFASTQIQSQETIDKFMCTYKCKNKKKTRISK